MKMKKINILIGLCIVALVVVIGLLVASSSEDVIKIGVIGHFSGDYASYGIPMKQAIELYVDEVNANGGIDGKKIQLVIEDDGSDAVKSASGMNKLVNVDNADYILSSQGSGATAVITPISQNNGKVLMITLGSAPGLTEDKNYVFRSILSDVFQGAKMVEHLKNVKPKTIAGLYRNDPYGVGIRDIVEKGYGNVVNSELYEPSSTDFRTQLMKIKQANPDVLIIAGASDNYPILFKQVKELGITSTVIVSETFYDKNVLEKIEGNAEGAYTLFPNEPVDYANFAKKYETKYGETFAYGMYAYDGVTALVKAIDGSKNKEEVREKLYNLQFNGASGSVGFDNEGDRIGIDYTIYQVRNGEFVAL